MSRTMNTVNAQMTAQIKAKLNTDKNITQKDIQNVCNALFEVVLDNLKKNDSVTINNFLKVKKVWRKERTYKNPKTGEENVKDAHYAVTVTAMPHLKRVVSSYTDDADEEEESDVNNVESDDNMKTDSDDKEEEEEEEVKPKKKATKKKAAAAPKKKGGVSKKVVESDDDNSDDE